MPGFSDISANLTLTCFAAVGDEALFRPAGGGAPVPLSVEFEEQVEVIGELGPQLELRPNIRYPRAVLGSPRRGRFEVLGRLFDIDQPVPGSGDTEVGHVFVTEVAGG